MGSLGENLLLVGSVPLDTVEEVLQTFGAKLGPHLPAVPDGEVGPRRHWISRVHYQVFAGHPELEILRRPRPDDGVERLNPHDASDGWQFRVADGVDTVRFGDPGWRLGFARDAVNSYFVFRQLREKGLLDAGLRFQVSLPTPNSVLPPRCFPVAGDIARIRPGYVAALAAEIDTICAHVPAGDLAIQWDCTNELQDAYGSVKDADGRLMDWPADGLIERNMPPLRELSAHVPEDALLGYHLCFGTLGSWPRFAPDDLSGAVCMANAMAEGTGRRVDWLHLPVLDGVAETFFVPLTDLEPRGARVYLGMIHNMDGFAERLAMARKYLPEFGVAAYCGFGRVPSEEMPGVLEEHLEAIAALK